MKHIFVVHSPITYLSTLATIQKENLDESNCLILSQNFNLNNAPIKICVIKNSIYNTLFRPYKKVYNALDSFISEESFVLYTPLLMHISRFLIMHPKCLKFNFTEEGLSAYYEYFSIQQHIRLSLETPIISTIGKKVRRRIKETLWAILGYSDKVNSLPTAYSTYFTDPNVIFYGFNEHSYKYAINRKEHSFYDVSEKFKFKVNYNLNEKHIWVGDPDIYLKATNINEFLTTIENGYICYLKRNNIAFSYLKFHPRDNEFIKKETLLLFSKNNIEVEVIKDETILEIELLAAKDATLVGFYSSLLLYGSIMGHKSYTIKEYASNYIDNTILLKQVPVFYRYVQNI